MRIGGHPLLGIADLHGAQQLQRLRARLIARRFAYGRVIASAIWSPTARIGLSARARVLEDHRHRRAVQMAEVARGYPA